MSRMPSHPPVATDIPGRPATRAVLNADGSGRLTIAGRGEELSVSDLAAARDLVIRRVAATADELGRPVRLTGSDPDGEWELAVNPDGSVEELAAQPAAVPVAPAVAPPRARTEPTAPPPGTPDPPLALDAAPNPPNVPLAREAALVPLTRTQRRWAGAPRERRAGRPAAPIAVALVLIVLAVATALIITNGPDTVVGEDPAPPRAISDRHEKVAAAGTAEAERNARQRRAAERHAAAKKRRERAARVRRVNTRRARQQGAARRRAAARRSAVLTARRRAAAARQRAAAAGRRAAATRPSPAGGQPQRDRPTPPTSPSPCGEFDLC